MHPEGPRSGKMVRCTMLQNVVERLNDHVGEIIIYGFVILLLTSGSYSRNRIWNSGLELWTDCVQKSPNKKRPHNNLGTVFLNQGKYPEAIPHINEALRINPYYAYAVTSNHIHLVIRDVKGEEVIPKTMQLIAGRTGQEYNQRKGRKGAFGKIVIMPPPWRRIPI